MFGKKLFLLIVGCMLVSPVVFCKDSSSGCGAGWYILKKNSLLSSTLRATTNAILLNQTFGMTSGTSNCAQHSIVKNEYRGIHYMESNMHQLMIDMAKGKGEYLIGFADAVDYRGDMQNFGELVQRNFERIYSDRNINAGQMYRNFLNIVTAELDNHII